MARKPDRFERMVEQVIGESPIMFTHETLKLLRRQHRAYVQMVKKDMYMYVDKASDATRVGNGTYEWDKKIEAMADFLTKVEQYKR
jgi:hypothetical protein